MKRRNFLYNTMLASAGIGTIDVLQGCRPNGGKAVTALKKIHWDDDKKLFAEPEANSLIKPNYRAPWTFPNY